MFKWWSETKNFIHISSSCSSNSSSTYSFTTEEITSFTNEAAKGAEKAQTNLPFCFFISCFIVSVTPLINTPKCSNDFMILTISFISSFEINPFPALRAPFLLMFMLNLFIAFKFKLLTNPGKLSLAKEIATF